MSILIFDPANGAAGDMITAALYGLKPDVKELSEIEVAGVRGTFEKVHDVLDGYRFDVKVEDLKHTHLKDINAIIDGLKIPEKVKENAKNVFRLLAEAESEVHGEPVELVHFHEVGQVDAIIDIVSACLLIDKIGPSKIYSYPICTGSGTVKTAHGVLPVPAPATLRLLEGLPVYSGNYRTELITPTGAALLKYFVDSFDVPVVRIEESAYGFGKKKLSGPNVLRAVLAEEDITNTVVSLNFDVDDMTGEQIGFACNELRKEALDVILTPVYMKKGRPGTEFTVLCRDEDVEKMVSLIFRYTSTIGIRRTDQRRYELARTFKKKEGKTVKISRGPGIYKEKTEYEDRIKDADGLLESE